MNSVRISDASLTANRNGDPVPNDSVTFRQLLTLIRRRLWLIAGVFVVMTGLATWVALREPWVYRASALIQAKDARQVIGGEFVPTTPDATVRKVDPVVSLSDLLRMRRVLAATVDSLGMQLNPITPGFSAATLKGIAVDKKAVGDTMRLAFSSDSVTARLGAVRSTAAYGAALTLGGTSFIITQRPKVSSAAFAVRSQTDAIAAVNGQLDVIVPRDATDVFEVDYVDPDPAVAQRTLNSLLQIYRAIDIQSAQEDARRRRTFLAEQLSQNDAQLATAQAALSTFLGARELASSGDELSAQQTALAELDAQRAALQAERRTYDWLRLRLQSADESERNDAVRALGSIESLASNPLVRQLGEQRLTYQARLDSLTTGQHHFLPSHPDVQQLVGQIRANQEQLTQAVASAMGALDARIASLASIRQGNESTMRALPVAAAEEARLRQRVDALSQMGTELRQEYEKAGLAEAVQGGSMEIVDPAVVPETSIWRYGPLKIGLGALVGLFLGGGLVLLLAALDTSIRRPEELEQLLPIAGLAVIPRLSIGGSTRTRVARVARSGVRPFGGARELAIDPLTPLAGNVEEAFRMLRTSLLYSDWGREIKSLMVTSVAPAEGTTITAANLAASAARSGMRVLLVDAALGRPRLHKVFRVPQAPGLVELLSNGTPPAGAFAAPEGAPSYGVSATAFPGLYLLPAGRAATPSAEHLQRGGIERALRALASDFDLIVIDTAPVLASADTTILSTLVDGVLLVLRAGRTDREEMLRAYQQLSGVGAHVVGAVLNDPSGVAPAHGRYYKRYAYAAPAGSGTNGNGGAHPPAPPAPRLGPIVHDFPSSLGGGPVDLPS